MSFDFFFRLERDKKKTTFYFTLLFAINIVHEKVFIRIVEVASTLHHIRRIIE